MLAARTQSLCPVCLRLLDATYTRAGDTVYLQKTCPQHGSFRVPVWQDAHAPAFHTWRQGARLPAYPAHPATALDKGCPYDCGLCPEHAQHTCTGLIEVTQRCSLGCPVCYARAGDTPPPDPDRQQIAAQLDALFAASGACNVQLSGGEPTERDDLPELVRMAKARGFGLVQFNTNGLRLARDPAYAATLKGAGLDSIYLQCDGVDDAVYRRLRGRPLVQQKQAALDACKDAGLGVVLVCTLARGINDHSLGDLLRWALRQGGHVRGLHMQPVSSFGRFPWALADAPRMTLPDVMAALERQTDGSIKAAHFHAPSCEHPLCSCSAVYGRVGDGLSATPLGAACCAGSTGLAGAPASHAAAPVAPGVSGTRNAPVTLPVQDNAEGSRKSKTFIAAHWASPQQDAPQPPTDADASAASAAPAAPATPATPPTALHNDFASFVQRSGADRRFTLSAMAFQDALSVDIARLRGCCIHVVAPDGRLIPFCAYNLTAADGTPLYRGTDGTDTASSTATDAAGRASHAH